MGICFIPRNTSDVHERDERTELSAAGETWLAWQVAEARELKVAVKGAYHALFEQVRRCAAQLELIDPDHRNAELRDLSTGRPHGRRATSYARGR